MSGTATDEKSGRSVGQHLEAALPDDSQAGGRAEARRSSARRWFISFLAIGLLGAVAAYLWRSPEQVVAFRRLSARVLVIALFLQFLSQLFSSAALLVPLRTHVRELGFWEFFIVRTGGFFAGYVVPVAGGVAVRLSYLRRRGLGYWDFAWATLLSNVLALVAAAVLAVCATAVLWAAAGTPASPVLGLSAGVLAISASALAVFRLLPRLAGLPRLREWRWLSGISGLSASRGTMTAVFGLSLARHCLNFATFGWLYQSLSIVPRGFLAGGLVYAIATPLRTIPITPGNLGVDEWTAAVLGKMLAFDLSTGLIVSLVFRGLVVLAQGLGLVVALAWSSRRARGDQRA